MCVSCTVCINTYPSCSTLKADVKAAVDNTGLHEFQVQRYSVSAWFVIFRYVAIIQRSCAEYLLSVSWLLLLAEVKTR